MNVGQKPKGSEGGCLVYIRVGYERGHPVQGRDGGCAWHVQETAEKTGIA